MKMIIVVALALVAAATAAPVESEPIQILRSEFNQEPNGGYVSNFETANGIVQQEEGKLKEVLDEENKPHTVVVVRGAYSYPDNQGKPQSITYYADETGFHAEGDSIPKVPARR